MIDDRAFEPDIADFFRELVNLRVGRVAEEKRDVSVGGNQYTDILQKELQLQFY